MGELLLIAAAVALMIGGVVLVTRLNALPRRNHALRRALMQVPETTIAAVKDGDKVRLKGRAVARAPLRTSPLSQLPCIGFRLTVDAWQDEDLPAKRVVEQEEFDSFALSDGTGEAVLHGPFTIERDPHNAGTQPLPPALSRILAVEGIAQTDFFGLDNHFEYAEMIVLPDDQIIAVGRATLEIDPAGRPVSHREPPFGCHLRGADEPVIIADAEDGVRR